MSDEGGSTGDGGGSTDATDALAESLGPLTDSVEEIIGESDLDLGDADDVRRALGSQLGGKAGREVGGRIGRNVGLTLASSIEEGKPIREALGDAWDAFVDTLAGVFENVDVDETMDTLNETVSELELGEVGSGAASVLTDAVSEAAGGAKDAAESGTEAATGAVEGDGESEAAEAEGEPGEDEASTEDAEETTEATETEEGSPGGEAVEDLPDISAIPDEQLRNLREDTFRQLLDVMSYSDLQSVAKEVGVKANLSREEMTDRIIESFSVEDGAKPAE